MSATIPETMPLSDLLKSTGYDCPEELQGKTFAEATAGGDVSVETNKAATIDVSQYTEPVVITPTEGKDAMAKATVTLSNIPSPEVDLETNKAATIDVSTYTEPAVIRPTEGKDGMEQATVTLTNIPTPGAHAYCWTSADITFFTNFSSAPASTPSSDTGVLLANDSDITKKAWDEVGLDDYTYEKVDDSTIKLTSIDDPTDIITLTRNTTKDFTLW